MTSITSSGQITKTPFIRRYSPEDAGAVADICVRTADAGADATGIYQDAAILSDLFAAPYAVLDPGHIDLLPSHQGLGFGRKLVDRLVAELAQRSAPAVHVGMITANASARRFYDRLGFHVIPIDDPDLTYLGLRVGLPAG